MSQVRIAAAADLHCRVGSEGKLRRALAPAADEADVMVLCGDLTDHGLVEEAEILAEDLQAVRLPKVAVLGNHDHESDQAPEVCKILRQAGVHLLQGDSWIFDHRVGFAGVKGFAGGFEEVMLQAWGEGPIKAFVREAVDQSLALEVALSKLEASGFKTKIALLHYAPIRATVVGEKVELFPFLGCSRLADVLDKQGVAAAFHGHAHKGSLKGTTPRGVSVYNVAMPLLRAELDKRYQLVEVDAPAHGERVWSHLHEQPTVPAGSVPQQS